MYYMCKDREFLAHLHIHNIFRVSYGEEIQTDPSQFRRKQHMLISSLQTSSHLSSVRTQHLEHP